MKQNVQGYKHEQLEKNKETVKKFNIVSVLRMQGKRWKRNWAYREHQGIVNNLLMKLSSVPTRDCHYLYYLPLTYIAHIFNLYLLNIEFKNYFMKSDIKLGNICV